MELSESNIDLDSRHISSGAARNALLPSVALVLFTVAPGLQDSRIPNSEIISTAPTTGEALSERLQQFGSRLLHRGFGQYSGSQSRGEIGPISLRTGNTAVRTPPAAVEEADSHRGAQRAVRSRAKQGARRFCRAKRATWRRRHSTSLSKEQELGAGSNYQTLTARRDLPAAESALVAAMTAYQKAKIELDAR